MKYNRQKAIEVIERLKRNTPPCELTQELKANKKELIENLKSLTEYVNKLDWRLDSQSIENLLHTLNKFPITDLYGNYIWESEEDETDERYIGLYQGKKYNYITKKFV